MAHSYKLKALTRVTADGAAGSAAFALTVDEGGVRGPAVLRFSCGSAEARSEWLAGLQRAVEGNAAAARGRAPARFDAAAEAAVAAAAAARSPLRLGHEMGAGGGPGGGKSSRRRLVGNDSFPDASHVRSINLTEAEDADLHFLLDEYEAALKAHAFAEAADSREGGGDAAVFEVALFQQHLEDELQAIEGANVHAILESKQAISSVLSSISSAGRQLDETDSWLEALNAHMTAMRADITAIEARNNELEQAARSHARLLASCEHLLQVLNSSDFAERAMASCALTGEGAPLAVRAAAELGDALSALVQGRDLPPPLRCQNGLPRSVAARCEELCGAAETFIRRAEGALAEELSVCVAHTIEQRPHWNPRPDHRRLHTRVREHLLVMPEADRLHVLVASARRLLVCEGESPSPVAGRHSRSPRVRLRAHLASRAGELLAAEARRLCAALRAEGAGMRPEQAFGKSLGALLPHLTAEADFMRDAFASRTGAGGSMGAIDGGEDDLGVSVDLEASTLEEALLQLTSSALAHLIELAQWVGEHHPASALCALAASDAWRVYGGAGRHVAPTLDACAKALREGFSAHISRLCERLAGANGGGERLVEPLAAVAARCGEAVLEVEMQRAAAEMDAVAVAAVEAIDESVTAGAFEAADGAVEELVSACASAIDAASQREKTDKRGFLLCAESFRALAEALGPAARKGAAAQVARSQAKQRAAADREAYLSALIGKNFGRPLEFLTRLREAGRTVAAGEVSLAAGFSRDEAARALKLPMAPEKAVKALKAKIAGHLGADDTAVGRVWAAACELLPARWDELRKALHVSYGDAAGRMLAPSPEELRAMMQKLAAR